MQEVLQFLFFKELRNIKIPKDITFIEEIRIRVGRPVMLLGKGREFFLQEDGSLGNNLSKSFKPKKEDLFKILQLISKNSIYAYQDELINGFITIDGGHRVGVVGKVIVIDGKVKSMVNFSGLNFRIAKNVRGCSDKILKFMVLEGQVLNTLIISPPGAGKTTMLRDVIRNLSNGISSLKLKGFKVGVVDERFELVGGLGGRLDDFDIGIRTDVLEGSPKNIGILMLLRTMSPQVVVTDEIGDEGDFLAIKKSINSGVKIITSFHGIGLEDFKLRAGLRSFLDEGLFDRVILLGETHGKGSLEEVYDVKNKKFLYKR